MACLGAGDILVAIHGMPLWGMVVGNRFDGYPWHVSQGVRWGSILVAIHGMPPGTVRGWGAGGWGGGKHFDGYLKATKINPGFKAHRLTSSTSTGYP